MRGSPGAAHFEIPIRGLVAGRQIDEHIPLARMAQEIAGEVEAVQPRKHDHVFLPWARLSTVAGKRDLGRALREPEIPQRDRMAVRIAASSGSFAAEPGASMKRFIVNLGRSGTPSLPGQAACSAVPRSATDPRVS